MQYISEFIARFAALEADERADRLEYEQRLVADLRTGLYLYVEGNSTEILKAVNAFLSHIETMNFDSNEAQFTKSEVEWLILVADTVDDLFYLLPGD